jgi:hypothetical protein
VLAGVGDVVAHAGEPLERVHGLEVAAEGGVHAGAVEDGLAAVEVDELGFAIHGTNDLGRGLVRVAAEGRIYYILGYVPSAQAKPGSYRRIEVRVPRPGLKVRARPGYVR